MPLLSWRDDYSVGIAVLDAQHKNLVELLNSLYDASRVGKGRDVLWKTLRELISYTRVHFATEEDFMKLHTYADLPDHKAEHDALTKKVIDFQHDFEAGKVAITADVLSFLRDWLTGHILETDRKYTPYLTGRGVH
jgi:hemerythrin